jgi:hypothetical protein
MNVIDSGKGQTFSYYYNYYDYKMSFVFIQTRTILPHEMQTVQSFLVVFVVNKDDLILFGHSHLSNCFTSAMQTFVATLVVYKV